MPDSPANLQLREPICEQGGKAQDKELKPAERVRSLVRPFGDGGGGPYPADLQLGTTEQMDMQGQRYPTINLR